MTVTAHSRRVVLACVLFALGAIGRPAGIVAQDAPMRWDGSIERLSSTDGSWPAADISPAQMSRHPMSADGQWIVFTLEVPNYPYPPVKQFFRRDRLSGRSEMFFGASAAAAPVVSADGNHIAVETCDSWWRYDGASICDVYLLDMRNYTIVNASTTPEGVESNAGSREPMLSRDGRFLVFQTDSTTLLPAGAAPGQIM
ncbi:MAG TPA: hypothetical protein VG106_00365, partial [Vicinamibacterales bacterium]|nr:hypothetical protein [Vicinamibacterales bacterium]